MPQIMLLRRAPDCIGTDRIKHAHNFYSVLSYGIGVCDRLNPLYVITG